MTTEFSGRGDPKRSVEILWGTKEPPSRGPKPGLSVEGIVQAAIRLADTEGLSALSMRRIANELGVTTMALYRYVPSKAELLDVMLDRVHGEMRRPDESTGGWREQLELSAREEWDLYVRHSWVLQVAFSRPPLGPNVLGAYEATLRAVAHIGLPNEDALFVVDLVSEYTQGSARATVNAAQVVRDTGITDEQWWETRASIMEDIFDSGNFPTIAQIYSEEGFDEPNAVTRHQTSFEFGLQRVLDGIELYVQRRQQERSTGDNG